MKNILKETTLFTILITYFIYCLTNNTYIVSKTIYSVNIWLHKIIPTLFPTFIIVDLIYSSNLPYYISKYLHLNYIYLLSIISGSPSNAYMLNKYDVDITKLLAVTKYTSPIFTYTFLKLIFNHQIALIIITCNILTNFILIKLLKPPKIPFTKQNNNILKTFITSLSKNINLLITILGTIIFFNTLPFTKITNPYLKGLILSILEITTSLNYLSITSIPLTIKLILAIISISTCGLCIECQIKSIINDTFINYSKYLKYRLFHLLIFFFLTFVTITLLI